MIYKRAMELVKALRSGEYKQGVGALKKDDKYCCLGVACELMGDSRLNRNVIELSYMKYTEFNGVRFELPEDAKTYYGFIHRLAKRRDYKFVLIDDKHYATLAAANDAGVTFDKIANYIEANWKDL